MKIAEITTRSSKAIKQVQRLYASYIINPQLYPALIDLLIEMSKFDSVEVNREIEVIKEKLKIELIEILKNERTN